MKKLLISVIALSGVFFATSAGAYYNDNCAASNNFCGGTVYRCDLYCNGRVSDYDYCNKHCSSWLNGGVWTNPNTNSSGCYTDYYGVYRCDSSYSSTYNNYNYNYGYNYGTSYPSWYPTTYWWWSQNELNLMTQSLNSETIAKVSKPDFFQTKVIRKDNNWKKLSAIGIKNFSFRAEDMQEKYDDSKRFVSALKDAIWQLYADGAIKNYQMADIITNLTDTVYNLNKHFEYSVRFEKTKDRTYDELAMDKLDDVKTNYDRLKGSLKWR